MSRCKHNEDLVAAVAVVRSKDDGNDEPGCRRNVVRAEKGVGLRDVSAPAPATTSNWTHVVPLRLGAGASGGACGGRASPATGSCARLSGSARVWTGRRPWRRTRPAAAPVAPVAGGNV